MSASTPGLLRLLHLLRHAAAAAAANQHIHDTLLLRLVGSRRGSGLFQHSPSAIENRLLRWTWGFPWVFCYVAAAGAAAAAATAASATAASAGDPP